ncbi:polysaccharide biosynthesis protein [Laribacter hongkongensis]|uniref:polysaccharide biosynthesis protein n=1 Tax=Laribacter hongkongensis TaxID=168471 RepID=UPI001EFD6995|nr:nucleoside-diphosphate sugar epimerase/dehydratase [Laribacter hongkongensis]MCG9056232.1 polysaccharide biosynthesis protein [Laribacter hongkongensis]
MKKPLSKLVVPVLALPRPAKRFVVLLVDLSLCVLTVWLAYYLRLGTFISFAGASEWAQGAVWAGVVSIGLALPVFIVSGLYRAIFRYSGWPALLAVARAVGIYGLLYASIFTAIGVAGVPRTVAIIQPMLLLLFVGASRALARVWLGDQYLSILKHVSRPKVLIYGAGRTGRQLAAAMTNSQEMQVAGFLDDDDRLHGHVLNGQPIYNPADLNNLATTLNISDVLLAMPGLSRRRRNEILSQVRSARVAVRTLPSVNDLAQGKVSISDLRELDIDDLLCREPVAPNHILLAKNIVGKVVLVTGTGGSIGSELCRQILAVAPAKLLLIEQNEFALYAIHQELEEKLAALDGATLPILVPLLVSVQDDDRMREIMSTWHPDTVYHAAAYKHVPLVEHNPAAGIKNNVLGTLRTAQAATENGVTNFVLISTDKAVRPTNVMGASKRLAEMALQALAANQTGSPGGTKFSMVRFGNVLGSSGSVVPKFRQQIRDGGPITLTHPDVTRYFMTIPEAAQLVIQAGAMAKGGDVFVLDMGLPVRIMDLARQMVELSGLTVKDEAHPEGDIEIAVTGLRPGEKLYEELLIGDNPKPTVHPRIMKAHEEFIPWAEFEAKLNALEMALNVNDVGVVRLMMQQLVAGYTPGDEIVDWVYMEQEAEALAFGEEALAVLHQRAGTTRAETSNG